MGIIASLENFAHWDQFLEVSRLGGSFSDDDIPHFRPRNLGVIMCTCQWYDPECPRHSTPLQVRIPFAGEWDKTSAIYMLILKTNLIRFTTIKSLAIAYCGANYCFKENHEPDELSFMQPAYSLVNGISALNGHVFRIYNPKKTSHGRRGSIHERHQFQRC